jgi:hypothetical protein
MKRIAWMLAAVLCSAMFLFAQDQNKANGANANDMTGWICNSKCVNQSMGKATCDKNCEEASGDVVFISDQGQVMKIASTGQDMAKPMAGKKCKMKATMDPDTGMLAPQNIIEYAGP